MSSDPVSPNRPSTSSPEEETRPVLDAPSNGFLIEETDQQQLDGEQLFRAAVTSEPAPSDTGAPLPPHLAAADAPQQIDNVQLARMGGFITIGLGVIVLLASRELPLPLFLVATGLILAFYVGSPARLTREHVVDRWDCLIGGAEGRGNDVVTSTTARIAIQALPSVSYTEREFAASLIRGGTRPFLVVTQGANGRLRPYKMYVTVRDYGTNLQTSWFLIYHRGFFERLKPNPMVELNLFDEQDLRAYVTAVHHAFLDGVIDLMLSLGKDSSTLDRKTKGFLGIS